MPESWSLGVSWLPCSRGDIDIPDMDIASPYVSVIIPTYNRSLLLRQTIDSVLAQTYTGFELIVVDDGSTDDTAQMILEYTSRYDGCVRYVYQANAGESVARQHGVDIAKGELLAFLDSDDLWLPNKLQRQMDFLMQHPEVAYVYSWAQIINREGNAVTWPILGSQHDSSQFSLEQLVLGNFIVGPGSTLLLRRAAYEACGGFSSSIRFAEDWDLCLRLAISNRFGCVCEPLVKIRLYERGWHQTRENMPRMLRDHLLLIEKFFELPEVSFTSLTSVRSRALANQYANAGFAYLMHGDSDEGWACLAKARELAPDPWAHAEAFMEACANYAVSFLAPNHPVERAERFIEHVAQTMPSITTCKSVTHERLFGWLYVTLAHHFWQIGNYGLSRQYIVRAMRADRSRYRQLGVWSLFARSMLQPLRREENSATQRTRQTTWLISLGMANEVQSKPPGVVSAKR